MNGLPKIALGAWAWGNDGTFGGSLTADMLRPIFDAGMAHGLNLWDTAYAYGMGTSEKVLASFLKGLPRESYLVSDKFTPQCASDSPTAMADMIEMQLKLMDLDRFDIYWIHNVWGAPHWTEEVAKYFEGKENVPMIGVSNHNLAEIRQADEILRAHGLRLSAVQNHYSLINRSSEDSGILKYCKENDIVFFSYMVLEQGALSGKYDTQHPMPEGSDRAAVYNPVLDKLETLNASMKKMADKYGVAVAQIPVAWAITKGTLPIIGVTKVSHVEDAAKAAEISLTAEEVRELETLADTLHIHAVRMWEKEMK
ncbi:MAG: aldo/keto reductase [Clostridia bacterium]|nr:aldo/keto reductase [Clostridia bacterium]